MHIMNGTHLTSLSEMIALHLDCRANLPGCYQHECIRPPPRYDLAAGNSLQNLSGACTYAGISCHFGHDLAVH